MKGECGIVNGLISAGVARSWAMLSHESSSGDSIGVDMIKMKMFVSFRLDCVFCRRLAEEFDRRRCGADR